jgi:hypothetical protein
MNETSKSISGSDRQRVATRGRGARSRRLAIESLEQRLALTTPYVDSDIYFVDNPFEYVTVPQDDAGISAAGGISADDDASSVGLFDQLPLGNYQLQFTDRSNLFGNSGFILNSTNSQVADSLVTNRGHVGPTTPALDFAFDVRPKIENLLAGFGASLVKTSTASDVVAFVVRPTESVDAFIERAQIVGSVLSHYQDAVGSLASLRLVVSHGDDQAISMSFESWLKLEESDDAGQLFVSGTPNAADEAPAALDSEGGPIPIEALVANVAGENVPLVGDAGAVVDWSPKSAGAEPVAAATGPAIAGELARAVAFEMIDGEAAPIVYAASTGSGGHAVTGQYVVTSTGHPALVAPNEQALAAAGNERSHSTARVADSANQSLARKDRRGIEPGSSAWYLAAANWSGFVDNSADDAFTTAFSELGMEEEAEAEKAARPQLWLAAMPVLAVLAAERIASSKKKSNVDVAKSAAHR